VNISIENKDEISIVKVSGEITFSTSGDLRKKLLELVDKGSKKIILNIGGVDYIDSSGMATMVEILQKIKSKDGYLALCKVKDKIKDILEMVKLKDLFEMFDTEEEAIESFNL